MNPYGIEYRRSQVINRKQRRRTVFSGGVLVFLLIFLASFALVYKQTLGQQLLLEVQNLKVEHKRLITEQSVYSGQKQEYLSREKIVTYATERLGLEFPDPSKVFWVQLEQVESVDQRVNAAGK